MAERKTGPVKPPTIDLTARPPANPAEGVKPVAAETSKAAPAQKPQEPAKPATPPTSPAPKPRGVWPAVVAGVAGGAVLGAALSYGVAYYGFWPADPALASLETRLAAIETTSQANLSGLITFNTRVNALEGSVNDKLAVAATALDSMQTALATASKIAATAAPDTAPLEAEIKALSGRVDALAAGATPADAGALATTITSLQQDVAGLGAKFATLSDHSAGSDKTLASLQSGLDAAKTALADAAKAPSATAIASAMQLPLVLSGLETAFATGRPFADDLARLKTVAPDAKIPASVAGLAASGLPQPDALAQKLDAAMPDILAARPASSGGSLQDNVIDWIKSVLAIRPAGEAAGDTPDAIASRLQASVDRHDFAAATPLFAQLPAPMQAAAGDLPHQIAALADASSFIAGLRAQALAAPATLAKTDGAGQ